jgi:hypothetical protein
VRIEGNRLSDPGPATTVGVGIGEGVEAGTIVVGDNEGFGPTRDIPGPPAKP